MTETDGMSLRGAEVLKKEEEIFKLRLLGGGRENTCLHLSFLENIPRKYFSVEINRNVRCVEINPDYISEKEILDQVCSIWRTSE